MHQVSVSVPEVNPHEGDGRTVVIRCIACLGSGYEVGEYEGGPERCRVCRGKRLIEVPVEDYHGEDYADEHDDQDMAPAEWLPAGLPF